MARNFFRKHTKSTFIYSIKYGTTSYFFFTENINLPTIVHESANHFFADKYLLWHKYNGHYSL